MMGQNTDKEPNKMFADTVSFIREVILAEEQSCYYYVN